MNRGSVSIVSVVGTASLALLAWAGNTIVKQGERITRVEVQVEDLRPMLIQLNEKVDKLLLRRVVVAPIAPIPHSQ